MTESKTKMRAVRIYKHGKEFDVLKFEDNVDIPKPGPKDVQVHIAWSGINFIDTYLRTGLYAMTLPSTLGREAAGIVTAIGDEVKDVKVGARVAFCEPGSGAYADYTVIPASRVVEVPKGMSLKMATASMLQGITAQYLLTTTYAAKPGDTVLIHAGAGGTGGLAVQIGKIKGATVITTVSTEEKAKTAKELGADHTILYTKQDFLEEVMKITNKQGVNVVYDSVGATTWEKSMKSLKPLGMLALFGNTTGPVPPIDPLLLSKQGSIFLTRPTMGHYILTTEALRSRATDVFEWVAAGKLKVRVAKEFPLEKTADAHEFIESRKADGKILLSVNPGLDVNN